MGNIFNYEGPVIQFLIKVFDMILVNLLWLVCSIPVVTLGAATTAMYTVTFQIVRGENPAVWKNFWNAFRDNCRQATIIWLIFLAAGAFIFLDLYLLLFGLKTLYFWEKIIVAILAVLAFIWLTMFQMVFPLLSQFENTVKRTILNSYMIPLNNAMLSLGLLIISVFIVVLGAMFAPFIGFGVWATVNSYFMNKLFDKYIPAEPQEEENAQ